MPATTLSSAAPARLPTMDRRHFLELTLYKVRADLKAEARQGNLGLLWWVVEPLLYLGAFYVIFGLVLERGGPDFVPWLLTGLVAWKWLDTSVRMAAGSIRAGRGLMNQVYLPKLFFPAVALLKNGARFLFSLALLLLFLMLAGIQPQWSWAALPAVLALQALVIAGLALVLAALVPLWPDLMLLVNNGLMLLFFLSGVFFDLAQASGWLHTLLMLNPVAPVLEAWRAALLGRPWPHWPWLLWAALFGGLAVWLGLWLLRRFDRHYPRLP